MAPHPKTCGLQHAIYEDNALEGQLDDAIRLLIVQPGSTDLISCQMSTVQLSAKPSYSALSYMWGIDECTKNISINGRIFPMRPNLWAFLNRLQHHKESTRIWIDAICVNQADLAERSFQVLLMEKIYGQAQVVLAWLGADLKSQGLNEDAIRLLYRDVTAFRAKIIMDKDRLTLASAARGVISDICLNAYWERAWIVQEVVLAHDVVLWYGIVDEINLKIINHIYWVLLELDNAWNYQIADPVRPAYQDTNMLERLLRLKYEPGTFHRLEKATLTNKSLEGLIDYSVRTRCSDTRDRIFAFLSLADDNHVYRIVPNYGRDPADLFYDILIRHSEADLYDCQKYPRLNAFAETVRSALGCTYADLLASSQFQCIQTAPLGGSNPFVGLLPKLLSILREHTTDSDESGSALLQVIVGPARGPLIISATTTTKGVLKDFRIYSLALFLIWLVLKHRALCIQRPHPRAYTRTSPEYHQLPVNLHVHEPRKAFGKDMGFPASEVRGPMSDEEMNRRYMLNTRVWTQMELRGAIRDTWSNIAKMVTTPSSILTLYLEKE